MFVGNTSLFSIEPENLHKKYICQEHFPPESFMNAFIKQRLISTAVPFEYKSEEQPSTSSAPQNGDDFITSTPTKTYTHNKSDIVELVFPSPPSLFSTPQKT